MALTAGSRAGTFLRNTELSPEAAKQLDDGEPDQIQHDQRDNGKNSGKVDADRFDDRDEKKAAHETAKQPGETQKKLTFVPATEF